jgi:hypothetical protein
MNYKNKDNVRQGLLPPREIVEPVQERSDLQSPLTEISKDASPVYGISTSREKTMLDPRGSHQDIILGAVYAERFFYIAHTDVLCAIRGSNKGIVV